MAWASKAKINFSSSFKAIGKLFVCSIVNSARESDLESGERYLYLTWRANNTYRGCVSCSWRDILINVTYWTFIARLFENAPMPKVDRTRFSNYNKNTKTLENVERVERWNAKFTSDPGKRYYYNGSENKNLPQSIITLCCIMWDLFSRKAYYIFAFARKPFFSAYRHTMERKQTLDES